MDALKEATAEDVARIVKTIAVGHIYLSSKNMLSYGVMSVGHNHVYNEFRKVGNGFVKTPMVAECSEHQVALQEIKENGKILVFELANMAKAIAEGTMTCISPK
jgi:hypothetical protein